MFWVNLLIAQCKLNDIEPITIIFNRINNPSRSLMILLKS